jgi:hypothetical protein
VRYVPPNDRSQYGLQVRADKTQEHGANGKLLNADARPGEGPHPIPDEMSSHVCIGGHKSSAVPESFSVVVVSHVDRSLIYQSLEANDRPAVP